MNRAGQRAVCVKVHGRAVKVELQEHERIVSRVRKAVGLRFSGILFCYRTV